MPHDTIAFNITFYQGTSYFTSLLSPSQLRKDELIVETMAEPNLRGSHKKYRTEVLNL